MILCLCWWPRCSYDWKHPFYSCWHLFFNITTIIIIIIIIVSYRSSSMRLSSLSSLLLVVVVFCLAQKAYLHACLLAHPSYRSAILFSLRRSCSNFFLRAASRRSVSLATNCGLVLSYPRLTLGALVKLFPPKLLGVNDDIPLLLLPRSARFASPPWKRSESEDRRQ